MARCAKCGKAAGIPTSIKFDDTRTGKNKTVKTNAALVGNKPTLNDQRGMNQQKLKVMNPCNGKK